MNNKDCFIQLLKKSLGLNLTLTKEFLLSIAFPCGGNNFSVAVEVMKKYGIEEHDARTVLNFWMEEHPFNTQVLKNTAISSDDIPLIYFNLFEIQSHIISLLTIMRLESCKIDYIQESYSSRSMQLAYGFDELINGLFFTQKFIWYDIYAAILNLSKIKKAEKDVSEGETKIFQCGKKIQQKMASSTTMYY